MNKTLVKQVKEIFKEEFQTNFLPVDPSITTASGITINYMITRKGKIIFLTNIDTEVTLSPDEADDVLKQFINLYK